MLKILHECLEILSLNKRHLKQHPKISSVWKSATLSASSQSTRQLLTKFVITWVKRLIVNEINHCNTLQQVLTHSLP